MNLFIRLLCTSYHYHQFPVTSVNDDFEEQNDKNYGIKGDILNVNTHSNYLLGSSN